MSVKGHNTRVKDLHRYEDKKERIFMSTRDLCLRLGWRFGQFEDNNSAEHDRFQELLYDVSNITDVKSDSAKAIRRELIGIHEQLDKRKAT